MGIESTKWPGYFEISGFRRYLISVDGVVINQDSGRQLLGGKNPAGYHNFGMINDCGLRFTWGRHRLLCFVFKPRFDWMLLVVNHINGIKGDDRLDNLEWVTTLENIHHAGNIGLSPKCLPISVRDCVSGKITEYPSIIDCARALGLSKDAVAWKVKLGQYRVTNEMKQFRLRSDDPWYIPLDLDAERMKSEFPNAVLIRCVRTGGVRFFEKARGVARYFGVSESAVCTWLKLEGHPVLPGFIQMKPAFDGLEWRIPENPEKELSDRFRRKEVICEENGVSLTFESANACAKHYGLAASTLNFFLRSPEIERSGRRFKYRF